jgi:3-hydroxybutyryl-CoA dehydrogenase
MTKEKIFIGIVGAGTMGSGIAQVAAMAGHSVFVYDEKKEALDKSKNGIRESLNKFIQKRKLSDDDAQEIFSRINFTDQIKTLSECRFVLEAVTEDLSAKQNIFQILEKLISPETVLATNTSSLSITSIAQALTNPGRVIGAHFFNPPVIMKLVEIVPAESTSQRTIDLTQDLMISWNKTAVVCGDTPGFIVNRVARPFYLEALRILEEGIAGVESIDEAMKKVGGFKMGPFELMDLIGNDINYKVTETIYNQTNKDLRYEPSRIQKEMVENNFLGKKTGKGFYDYNNPSNNNPIEKNNDSKQKIFMRIISAIINEAAEMIRTGNASVSDIDKAMMLGANYPKGPLLLADEIGLKKIINEMQSLSTIQKKEYYKISSLLIEMSTRGEYFYNDIKKREIKK